MMYASPEARWLAERSAATGYVILVLSALCSGQGGHTVICFCMPASTEGGAYSVGSGVLWQRRRREGE